MADASSRPIIATVFGILDILIGVMFVSNVRFWNSLTAILGDFYNILLAAGVLLGVLILAAGILLLINRGIALRLNLYYAWASIGLAVLRTFYVMVKGGSTGVLTWMLALGISLVYPLLILVFLLKNGEVKSFYSSR